MKKKKKLRWFELRCVRAEQALDEQHGVEVIETSIYIYLGLKIPLLVMKYLCLSLVLYLMVKNL